MPFLPRRQMRVVIECDCQVREPSACPDCRGTQWLVRRDGEGREIASPCHCRAQRLVSTAESKLALGKKFRSRTFESFDPAPENEIALDECLRWAHAYPRSGEDGQGIWLFGGGGTGKTHLLAAILNHVKVGMFINTAEWLERLRNARGQEGGSSVLELLEAAKTPPVLVLDDLGAERIWRGQGEMAQDTFVAGQLYQLINHRYEHALPMLLSSNQSPEEIEGRLGERIVDRLLEMCQPLRMTGDSYRQQIRAQKVKEQEENQ